MASCEIVSVYGLPPTLNSRFNGRSSFVVIRFAANGSARGRRSFVWWRWRGSNAVVSQRYRLESFLHSSLLLLLDQSRQICNYASPGCQSKEGPAQGRSLVLYCSRPTWAIPGERRRDGRQGHCM